VKNRVAALAALVGVACLCGSAFAQNDEKVSNIQDVFSDFEAICFNYGEHGYSVEVTYLIEKAGFRFVQRTRDGADIFNSNIVQLVIGEKACAFGMPRLPFVQMLEWTKQWIQDKGLTYTNTTKSGSGGEYWVWGGQTYFVGLEDDRFPDGTPLTGLILTRK
jgi:hypothetical protein